MKLKIIHLLNKVINWLQKDELICPTCNSCGFIDCCGVKDFLDNHIKGKTNCLYEEDIMNDINEIVNNYLNKNNE